MRLGQLIKSVGVCNPLSDLGEFEVSGISCNSENIKDNFIFVAIRGTRQDGHKFIRKAIDKGAKVVIVQKPATEGSPEPKRGETSLTRQAMSADRGNQLYPASYVGGQGKPEKASFIVVEDTRQALAKLAAEFYGHPSKKIKVVGITGTNGKTTVSYLLEALLKGNGFNVGVIGTVNYRFKDRVLPSKNTTPGPVELESMLADMLNEEVDYVAIEVSSHALDQARIEGIDFHSAIFTNLTQDHLDYHKTLENYFQTKCRLFRDISPGSFVVVNNDDAYGRRLKKLTKAEVITYGITSDADVIARDIKFYISHTEFYLKTSKAQIHLKTKLVGRHNVHNILAVVSWALKEGIDLSAIKSALENFCFVPGRLEKIDSSGNFSVFVDYAHTEDALRNVLEALRQLCQNRLIVVFGCGGERDRTKRPKMGEVVSSIADWAIITNDNPRSEDPEEIINDIRKGIKKNNYCIIPERFEAVKRALSLAQPGDIVLIAGKGHENYQLLKDKVIHFDDREAVRECLRSVNY